METSAKLTSMLQAQLKLRLTVRQEKALEGWLWHLTGVYNWASRKIELDAKDKIYHSGFDLQHELKGSSDKLDIPAVVIRDAALTALEAWQNCFKKLKGKPKLKSNRNRLRGIGFPVVLKAPVKNRIKLPIIGSLKFHKQKLPSGKIKQARILKKASGWYLCLFIDTNRQIVRKSFGSVGIDPGFKDLLTLSTGEKVAHPRELERSALRLAQAQKGRDETLAARIQERIANQKKDRNHKLSLDLVTRFSEIYFSKDNTKAIAKKFGKSVSSSNHYQLRKMIQYKSLAGGTKYIEVDSKFSTQDCSACGARKGPKGWNGLKVREWRCSTCGVRHDRDHNAAVNTLIAGRGSRHESGLAASGT
jgi:putative transposase